MRRHALATAEALPIGAHTLFMTDRRPIIEQPLQLRLLRQAKAVVE